MPVTIKVLLHANGPALWPARFSATDLQRIKKTLSPYFFSALYQQRPVPPEGGGMFRREWFPIVDAAPVDCRKVRYWDLAASEAKPGKASDPDWTVGALMGRDARGVLYLIDIRRVRATPAGVEALVQQTAEMDGRTVPVWMEQEPGSSGVNTIDYYRRQVLQGWAFYPDKVTGPKEVRAAPFSSQAEAGNVKLVRGPWIGAFLDEADSFPLGSHDDMIDACAGGYAKLSVPQSGPALSLPPPPSLASFRVR